MPEFEDMPPEMVNVILSHCTKSAVLQLRMVSKRTRAIVAKSQKFKDLFKDIWIELDSGMLLGKFMREVRDLPIQNLSIDMDEPEEPTTPHLLKDPLLLQKFIQRFSASIRNLRVSRMYCGTVVGEMKFYESLENLRSLEIERMEPFFEEEDSWGLQECPREFPTSGPVGRSMKSLEVDFSSNSGNYFMELIRLCPSLEVLKVPSERQSDFKIGVEAFGEVELLDRESVYPYVLRLGSEGNLQRLKKLKILDLNGLRMELRLCNEEDRRFFHDLLTRRNDFRLKNVSAAMLEELRRVCVFPEWPWGLLELFKQKVVSTCGMHQMLKEDDGGFAALEEVRFTVQERPLGFFNGGGRMALPRLKTIDASVMSYGMWGAENQDFLDRLFLPDIPRETVEELHFWFKSRGFGFTITPAYFDRGFPNVTRVYLSLDNFNREQLVATVEVMSRKDFLEDLSLQAPIGIPEDAFFGVNEADPLLLRMTNLRKLSLISGQRGEVEVKGDLSLGLFARMSLTHLTIKGGGWERVTSGGILALTEGPFGESVVSVDLDGLKGRDEGRVARSGALVVVKGVARRNKDRWMLNSA